MMQKINMKNALAVFVLIFFTASVSLAEKNKNIELTSSAEIEVMVKNEKGKETKIRKDASKANVIPGTPVIFTIYYKNAGNKPATDIVITNPVSPHISYMGGTAEGENAQIAFSVDKGKTFAAPEKLKVRDADGKERAAKPEEYTHIQWTLKKPVSKGENGSVSFKAKVK